MTESTQTLELKTHDLDSNDALTTIQSAIHTKDELLVQKWLNQWTQWTTKQKNQLILECVRADSLPVFQRLIRNCPDSYLLHHTYWITDLFVEKAKSLLTWMLDETSGVSHLLSSESCVRDAIVHLQDASMLHQLLDRVSFKQFSSSFWYQIVQFTNQTLMLDVLMKRVDDQHRFDMVLGLITNRIDDNLLHTLEYCLEHSSWDCSTFAASIWNQVLSNPSRTHAPDEWVLLCRTALCALRPRVSHSWTMAAIEPLSNQERGCLFQTLESSLWLVDTRIFRSLTRHKSMSSKDMLCLYKYHQVLQAALYVWKVRRTLEGDLPKDIIDHCILSPWLIR